MTATAEATTLAGFAMEKHFPERFLLDQGLHDLPGGGIGYTYYDESGQALYVKERGNPRRRDDKGEPIRFWVPPGTRQVPFGLPWLGDRGQATELNLMEGES